jgi:hypothetical protein
MVRHWSRTERAAILDMIERSIPPGPARESAKFEHLCGTEAMSRRDFLEACTQIPDKKSGRIGAWRFNRAQRFTEATRLRLERSGRPVRIATLKARKWGCSTHWLCYGIEFVTRHKNVGGVIVADEEGSAKALLETGKRVRTSLPFHLPTKYENRSQLYFDAPLYSFLDIETAKNEDPCRGRTYRFVHCTEPQIWKDPEKRFIALVNSVPSEPGTVISLEGTANGYGWWHDFWFDAFDQKSDWLGLFFPWHYDKDFDYCLALQAGDAARLQTSLDDEERSLIRGGATLGQLKWRRGKIKNDFQGDVLLFHQEYPSTPQEAFLASGRPVFVQSFVCRAMARARKPIWKGDIYEDESKGEFGCRFGPSEQGSLTVWAHPREGRAYAIGSDSGHGIGGDPSAAIVVDVESAEQVAELHGQIEPRPFGRMIACLGNHYNEAWWMPEVEGPGMATLDAAKEVGYPQIALRSTYDSIGRIMGKKMGFSNNVKTRPLLFNAIREHLGLGEEGAQFHSAALGNELLSMFMDDSNRETCPKGKHDDRVIAWGIALLARRDAVVEGFVETKKPAPRTLDEMHWQEYHRQTEAEPEPEDAWWKELETAESW